MPRTLPTGLTEALVPGHYSNLESHSTLEVSIPAIAGSYLTYRWATAKIKVGGVTFQPHLRQSSPVRGSLTRSADRVEVMLQNADAALGVELLLVHEILYGAEVKFGRYWRDESGAEFHKVLLTGVITGLSVAEDFTRLVIVSDAYAPISVGASRRVARLCQWRFRGPDCGYAGPEMVCNLMLNDAGGCEGRHGTPLKQAKFGGFVHIESKNSVAGAASLALPAANQLVKHDPGAGVVAVKQQPFVRFQGAGVTVTNDDPTESTVIDIAAGGHTLRNNDVAVPTRPIVDIPLYHPLAFVDDNINGKTYLKGVFLETAVRNLVTDFGADPLGIVDCTSALEAALASRSRVVIPAGSYKFDSTIDIPTANPAFSFILDGHGIGTTLLTYTGTGHAFLAPNGSSDMWQMRNFRLVCSNAANTGDGIRLMADASGVNTHILLENIGVWNFGRWGLNADNLQSSVIRNCHFRGNKAGHIRIVDPDAVDAVKEPNANSITECLLDNILADDQNIAVVYLFNANNTLIQGCTIQGNFTGSTGNLHAIYAEDCDSLHINNVWVENAVLGVAASAVKLVNSRGISVNGYHGGGLHAWDFEMNDCRSVTFRGITLSNSVPHFVCNNTNDVSVYGSILSHPQNIWVADSLDHIYIHSDCHYHTQIDRAYKEYGSTNSLWTGWGENWLTNANLVDDSLGWTLNATYVSRVATGSPSGIGGYFLFDPGATPGGPIGGTILEQIVSIPDSVAPGHWTVSWDYYIENDGAADNAAARVCFGVTATGQSEHGTFYRNQLQNYLPLTKWVRNCISVYLPAGTTRTIRLRLVSSETTSGPDTPKVRLGNFQLAPGREAQPGGHKLWAEDQINYLRQPIFAPARPSTPAPPAGYGGWRFNGTNWQEYTGGTWVNIGGASGVTGSGTTGKLAKFTGASAIGDSLLSESATVVQFNGSTSSFPGLKRSSAELQVRLADDSGYATLRAQNLAAQGDLAVAGAAAILGNTSVDCTGSSTGSPRLLGLVNIGASTAARFQFGDGFNSVQLSNGGRMIIQSFHGLKIHGHTFGVTTGSEAPVGFSANDTTDPHVEFVGSNGGFSENVADNTHVQIRGASNMSAGVTGFFRCVTSGGTERFAILEDGDVKVAGSQVLTARQTGWGAPTGTLTRTTFDTATVTLPQLAERVAALLDDLGATNGHGLIGA